MQSLHGSRRMHALMGLMLALGATPVAAQEVSEKLTIHGYLTQAYAIADTMAIMGMPTDGTSDYRRAALLFRYDASMRDKFVMQLAHRRLGVSPTQAFESDLKLDWGFYEGRFGEATRLRVGRAPIPIGIYNETRYVGTVMPFYRAPYVNYNEGSYTAEAIDGITLTRTFLSDAPYSVEVTGYVGSYGFLESGTVYSPTGTPEIAVARAHADRAAGAWIWLDTPVDGLRLGGGFKRATTSGGLHRVGTATSTENQYFVSVDGSFDDVFLRAESRHDRYEGGSKFDGAYGQAGVHVASGFWLNGQVELGKAYLSASQFAPALHVRDLHRDYALGVNYVISSQLVLKLEGHRTRGYNTESTYNFYDRRPFSGRYLITSLSASF